MNTLQIDTLNVNIVQSMRAAAGKGAPKASPSGRARPWPRRSEGARARQQVLEGRLGVPAAAMMAGRSTLHEISHFSRHRYWNFINDL